MRQNEKFLTIFNKLTPGRRTPRKNFNDNKGLGVENKRVFGGLQGSTCIYGLPPISNASRPLGPQPLIITIDPFSLIVGHL